MKLRFNKYAQNNHNIGKEGIKLQKLYVFMESVLYNETNSLLTPDTLPMSVLTSVLLNCVSRPNHKLCRAAQGLGTLWVAQSKRISKMTFFCFVFISSSILIPSLLPSLSWSRCIWLPWEDRGPLRRELLQTPLPCLQPPAHLSP